MKSVKYYCSISQIYKNIFISDIKNACDVYELKRYNIKAVLYLGTSNKDCKLLDRYADNNISHKFLQIGDTNKAHISDCFEPAWNFINNHVDRGNSILIHCVKGISRSPTIVTYYLTRKIQEKMSLVGNIEYVVDDILDLIKEYRPCINPNKNFIKQLKNYEHITVSKFKNELERPSIPV